MPLVTSDRALKHARLAAVLDANRAESIHLTQPETLAWYFDGARTGVPYGGRPVFSAVIHRNGRAIVTAPENEVDRLSDEEIGGAEFHSIPWFDDVVTASPPADLRDAVVTEELRAARAALLPTERDRYRALGRATAQAMTQVLSAARPDMTEAALAADLLAALTSTGATPSVVLVAGAARASIQHPLPTSAALGNRAMAVVTAVRFGLHLSMTRWVRFGGTSSTAQHTADEAVRELEADIISATIPGRTLGDVVNDIALLYPRHGFGDQSHPAWRRHHQGGPTGYLGRDPKAAPGQDIVISAGGAFAWNPWVPGSKIEDTVIVDEGSVEVLSHDPAWPTTNVRGLARPLTLDLG